MNKQSVLDLIIARLTDDLALYVRAAETARFEATDEQSKAENKYDTRGLEASYLARGQSRQAAETEHALIQFQALPCRLFAAADPIDLGALVALDRRKERTWFLVGPNAGGVEVTLDGEEITVITPQSPLGQQLVGHRVGERFTFPSGETGRIASIA